MDIKDIKVRRNGNGGSPFIQNTIRFPPDVYERVREEADRSGRSLHAEILHRVIASFGEEFALKGCEAPSVLERIAEDLRALREAAEKLLSR
ncbi:hypothetical protein GCM10027276_04210 [Comamonas piscis]